MTQEHNEILVDHPTFSITQLEELLYVVHHKSGEMSLSDFKTLVGHYKKLHGKSNKKTFILNTQDDDFNYSIEAWKYVRKEAKNFTFITAQALVAKQLHFRLLAKIHIKATKGHTLVKVFADSETALIWLKEMKAKMSA